MQQLPSSTPLLLRPRAEKPAKRQLSKEEEEEVRSAVHLHHVISTRHMGDMPACFAFFDAFLLFSCSYYGSTSCRVLHACFLTYSAFCNARFAFDTLDFDKAGSVTQKQIKVQYHSPASMQRAPWHCMSACCAYITPCHWTACAMHARMALNGSWIFAACTGVHEATLYCCCCAPRYDRLLCVPWGSL